jgi:glycosyltransferase involved in cell wall biosynthesis
MKAKILLLAHSPALPSGMAEMIRLIFETLLGEYPDTYELQQIGLVHTFAVSVPRWPIHPTRTVRLNNGDLDLDQTDAHGEKTLAEIVEQFQPDVVFAYNDPQSLAFLCAAPRSRSYKLILYTNLDGYPFPEADANVFRPADLVLTCSEFARRVLVSASPALKKKTRFMYSPADVERFKPIADEEKVSLRQDILPGWMPEDAFVLGWIGRNQWRKQIWLPFAVLHYLRTGKYLLCQSCDRITLIDWHPAFRKHNDELNDVTFERRGLTACHHCRSTDLSQAAPLTNIFLWFHSIDKHGQGDWPLKELEIQFDIRRERDIYYTEGMGEMAALAPADMPILFQLWDALLYLSGGEGFGLPAWEAMCAGLPVVYSDYSSHAEFLRQANGGLPVGGILQPEAKTCIWRMIADVPEAIAAVRKLYYDRKLCRQLGTNGRSFVQQYTPEIQARRWHEIFQSVLNDKRGQPEDAIRAAAR